jgi:hypothetical protein
MAALAVLLAISSVLAYPRPNSVATRWELEFKPGDLRLYMDPGEGEVEAYWYFTYMVTNRTGRDQVWAPTFVLFTDEGEILPSGRGVPSRVAADIQELLANKFLEHQNEIIGEIYHGRDHAKEGLVVWPARTLDINEMSAKDPPARLPDSRRRGCPRQQARRDEVAAVGDAINLRRRN